MQFILPDMRVIFFISKIYANFILKKCDKFNSFLVPLHEKDYSVVVIAFESVC